MFPLKGGRGSGSLRKSVKMAKDQGWEQGIQQEGSTGENALPTFSKREMEQMWLFSFYKWTFRAQRLSDLLEFPQLTGERAGIIPKFVNILFFF